MADEEGDAGTPKTAPVIDVHSHAMPLPLLIQLAAAGLADLSGISDGVLALAPVISGLKAGAFLPLVPEQYDVDARLESMTRMGVTHQAVSAPPFVLASQSTDHRLVLDITRRSNDEIARFVSRSGGRLVGLATAPVGIPGAMDELARCLDELGFAGAAIGTFGGGTELDDPVNEELWEMLAERRCFVLMHPSRASSPTRLADYYLVQLLGYPAETALATARLIFGGVLDRHDLTLCLAHGGGCLSGIGPRLDLGWRHKTEARVMKNAPSHYLRRLWYDTAVFDTKMLGRLVEDVGAAQVLLGTDTPFDLADREPLDTVRALKLPAHEQDAILSSNALTVLPALAALVREHLGDVAELLGSAPALEL